VGRIGSGVRVSASLKKNPRRTLSYGSKKSYDLGRALSGGEVCPGAGFVRGVCPKGAGFVGRGFVRRGRGLSGLRRGFVRGGLSGGFVRRGRGLSGGVLSGGGVVTALGTSRFFTLQFTLLSQPHFNKLRRMTVT